MGKDHDSCLLLFLKFPVTGTVKTRLAQEIGEIAAYDLYRCFVADTVALSRLTGYPTMVFFDPPSAKKKTIEWLGREFSYEPQRGAELGERMYGALKTALKDWRKAVLIGSDIPGLPPAFVHEALQSLDTHDAVIGPALDGGYYLIGFSAHRLFPGVFEGMPWGSGLVFKATMKAFEKQHLTVHVLPGWRDVDRYQDLESFFLARRDLPPGSLSTIDYLRNHYGW